MPQFHEAVRSGRKRQTIRPLPKVFPEIGDKFIAEAWANKPYRSKVVRLAEGIICEACALVTFDYNPHTHQPSVRVNGGEVPDGEAFARADGFTDFKEMLEWFFMTHGLPFRGCLIKWMPSPEFLFDALATMPLPCGNRVVTDNPTRVLLEPRK